MVIAVVMELKTSLVRSVMMAIMLMVMAALQPARMSSVAMASWTLMVLITLLAAAMMRSVMMVII
jgi:hypothetical protein